MTSKLSDKKVNTLDKTLYQLCDMLQELKILYTHLFSPQFVGIAGLEHIKFNFCINHTKEKTDTHKFLNSNIPLY